MVFIGKCMTGFNLAANYHMDPESLLRKPRSRLSSPGSSRSLVREVVEQFQVPTTLVESVPMATNSRKCIKTGSEMNIGDSHFELKPELINMVQ
jgi:hypothetical protein